MIVCCVGRKRSGKDTFFEELNRHLPHSYRMSFADNIKKISSNVFNIPLEMFHDNETKDKKLKLDWSTDNLELSPRDMCIQIGSSLKSVFGKNFWIDQAFSKGINKDDGVCVVTDVRYTNEIEYIIENFENYMIFYIDADDRLGPMPDNAHDSETTVYVIKEKYKKYITVIDNNKDEESFKNTVKKIALKF